MNILIKIFTTTLCAICFGIFINIDSAYAVDYPFSLTTTEIAANGTFQFKLSAQGTFYVDCGNGGNLSSDDSTANAMISGGTITKNDVANYIFKCTYSTAGTKTIRFGGTATGYNTSTTIAAISFLTTGENSQLVSSISGNISVIFPYLGHGSGQAPRFFRTFYVTNINSIPETLFANYTGDLSGANYMFFDTFSYVYTRNLTQIPENLFSGITIGAPYMFYGTFYGCVRLTSIPENLFANITNSADGMFEGAFGYCARLTSLPKNLFAHFTTAASYMFYATFADCGQLRGYVPKTLFAGLIANNSPYATDMMTDIFGYSTTYNSKNNLDTTCPAGTTQYRTGYEQYWETGNGTAVSCEPNTINITFDGANANSCSYGDTFAVPPAPAPRTGYVFTGWKVKTVNP